MARHVHVHVAPRRGSVRRGPRDNLRIAAGDGVISGATGALKSTARVIRQGTSAYSQHK